ncbi:MAG: erythromycin esterase family protein, partial [Burkholderiales bacterium]|nr:erythromycin esterase family protein [Burkholderiales bacterium]
YPDDAILVGFMTATGSVRAATDWGGPDRRRRLRAPIQGSHAALMHATGLRRFLLFPDAAPAVMAALDRPRPQRGVGVRYLPELELAGHYYMARLSGQFDALIHIDRTTALRPPRRK